MNAFPVELQTRACYPRRSVTRGKECSTVFPRTPKRGWIRGIITLLAISLLPGCGVSLHDAVAQGTINKVQALLDRHPDWVNAQTDRGKTPLHYAVSYAQTPCMDLLLQHGADINARDATGMTPLHVAAMLGRAGEAHWLLNHGAQRDVQDAFGDTPLHTAAVFGQGNMVTLFLEAGGDRSMRNAQGKTPVELANANRHPEVAALLQTTPSRSIQ